MTLVSLNLPISRAAVAVSLLNPGGCEVLRRADHWIC